MKDLIVKWFEQAINLPTGKEILLECESKQEQTYVKKILNDLKKEYHVDPVEASKISVRTQRKDRRFWVIIRKRSTSLMIGFIRDENSNTEKLVITENNSLHRQVYLMNLDGLSHKEISDTLGITTEEVVRLLLST
jgi:hypothetical protein